MRFDAAISKGVCRVEIGQFLVNERDIQRGAAPSGDAVGHVPVEHLIGAPVGVFGAVEDEAEAAVDDFAPTDAAAVVQRHPGGAAEAVADAVLNGHVCPGQQTKKNKRKTPKLANAASSLVFSLCRKSSRNHFNII